jgi:hypothetical protein
MVSQGLIVKSRNISRNWKLEEKLENPRASRETYTGLCKT